MKELLPCNMKFLIVLFFLFAASACRVNRTTSTEPVSVSNPNTISPDNPAMSLADYLKRVPGVHVSQNNGTTMVTVRGTNTLDGQREPLFIINGANVGFGYEKAEPLVAITDIESVQVLKSGQETAAYGMQGTNGVIIIRTKK